MQISVSGNDALELQSKYANIHRSMAKTLIKIKKKGVEVHMTGDQIVERILIDGDNNQALIDALNEAISESKRLALLNLQKIGRDMDLKDDDK